MRKKKVPRKGTTSPGADRRSVFSTIKRALRARRITYADLARPLGLSESG